MSELEIKAEVVITLKDITDLLDVQHSKAMIKVESLALEPSFGWVSKMDFQYKSGKNTTQTIQTYSLTKRQAIAVGAKLNNALLMKLIDRLEELETPKKQMTYIETLEALVISEKAKEEARAEAKYLQITLDKSEEYASIKKMEKEYEEKFSYRILINLSKLMGIEIKKVFDQNYGTVNSYHKDVWLSSYNKEVV